MDDRARARDWISSRKRPRRVLESSSREIESTEEVERGKGDATHFSAITTMPHGGPSTRPTIDGGGPVPARSGGDAGTDASRSHAGTGSDDNVLTQTNVTYDVNGNNIQLTVRQRYDPATLAQECAGA